ncbi:unnamed protein product [Rotaria sp. Silwood2]|nr:unnamed protein product [Rotaria sp. Silwood2]CAF4401827.1 unnamed protein product [Rotaria sp. Silwood2]
MAHLLVENSSLSSDNDHSIISTSPYHWLLEPCTLSDSKVVALVRFGKSDFAIHLHPKDKRGYRSVVRLINNDRMISTINRDYPSAERIGLALTMALVTEVYSRIVPIAQSAVTGNNTRSLDPKPDNTQLFISQEPIFLHGYVFGCGDPEEKYIEDVQMYDSVVEAIFDMNSPSSQESKHDKQVPWKLDEMKKVVRRLETEIDNIHDA